MRKVVALGGFVLLGSLQASAASLCTTAPLSTYTAAGYACAVGANLFSNFTYTATGPQALAAGAITVSPAAAVGNWIGLQFTGTFAVSSKKTSGSTAQQVIGYRVNTPLLLVGDRQAVSGGLVHRSGSYSSTETVRSAGGTVLSTSTITATSAQIVELPLPAGSTSFYLIENNLLLSAPAGSPSNTASVNGVTNLFDAQPAPTPEPGTASLVAGVLLLAAARLLRRQRRSGRG